MNLLRVKNWAKYQHYKDRCPPWIKLATNTFQDYDFSRLQDASKLLAVCIWTLAARSQDGSLPHDFAYIKSQCCLGQLVDESHLNELITNGFLDASSPLAECKQNACLETEKRRDRDRALAANGTANGTNGIEREATESRDWSNDDTGINICKALRFSGIKHPQMVARACPYIRERMNFKTNQQVMDWLPDAWRRYMASDREFKFGFEKWLGEGHYAEDEPAKPAGSGMERPSAILKRQSAEWDAERARTALKKQAAERKAVAE